MMDLRRLTIKELSEKLTKREISSVELTKAYLDRIHEDNPKYNVYTCISEEEALKGAEAADKAIGAGEAHALSGIPMGIKDNMCTKGVATTCASKMLQNFVPPYTATAVERLYSNGAVSWGSSTWMSSPWAAQPRTPFSVLQGIHGILIAYPGSSGGSAAAVAAGLCAFSLGSDTGGSIRQPAAFCGVVGLKPTYGLVSRYGLVAFASSLDQIGPITRDVYDCALVLGAIAAHDPLDSTSVEKTTEEYAGELEEGVGQVRIGLPREYYDAGLDEGIKSCIMNTVKLLEGQGASSLEVSLPGTPNVVPAYYLISSAEASANLARFDGIKYGYRSPNAKNLSELYRMSRGEGFGREVKRRILLGTHALSSGYHDELYNKALKVRRMIAEDFSAAFEKCDVIVAPTYPTTAFKIGEKIEDPLKMYLGDIHTAGVNLAGLPALVVPCGLDEGGCPSDFS
jgi:aspartyl-tRNA(Asn)/glutamyl-tRNA(Gln) amidotransferase subunit A